MTKRKKPEDFLKKGRKSDFREEYVEKAYRYALLGLTDIQMAGLFGVSQQTLNSWKKQNPLFLESLKAGKDEADSKVSKMLLQRAMGYEYEEIHEEKQGKKVIKKRIIKKQLPPDTTAMIFWLKNRQPELWRDKIINELQGKDGSDLQPTVIVLPANSRDDVPTTESDSNE